MTTSSFSDASKTTKTKTKTNSILILFIVLLLLLLLGRIPTALPPPEVAPDRRPDKHAIGERESAPGAAAGSAEWGAQIASWRLRRRRRQLAR